MDGTFELNKMGFYTPVNVIANDFLNSKLESDQYGLYYSVRFEGDAETYLWQSKTKPEEHVSVWGHIEESKSGKSMRFKKDKDAPVPFTEDSQGAPISVAKVDNRFLKDVTSVPLDVYRVRANINGLPDNAEDASIFWELVKSDAEELLKIIGNIRDDA